MLSSSAFEPYQKKLTSDQLRSLSKEENNSHVQEKIFQIVKKFKSDPEMACYTAVFLL